MTLRSLPLAALTALAAMAAAPDGARAAPVLSVLTTATPVRGIDSVNFDSAASVLSQSTVTATFSDGSQLSSGFVIQLGGGFQASATTSGFLLTVESDSSPLTLPLFTLRNLDDTRTLTALRIDGRGTGSGRAAFDLRTGTDPTETGTPGSEGGLPFSPQTTFPNSLGGTLTATFLDPLALPGSAPFGDLFASLQVDFDFESTAVAISGLPPQSQSNGELSRFKFIADIDTVTYTADGPPPKDPQPDPQTDPTVGSVPEPASASLLGLAALLGWAMRRRAERSGT